MAQPLRIYVDTSVIGGCLDEEFAEDSLYLMQMAREGRLILLVSAVVAAELTDAPPNIRDLLESLPEGSVRIVHVSEAVERLRNAYLDADVIGERWRDDATHVAAATVSGADAIVSWNFRHIVRLDRIKGYNEVNRSMGYAELTIVSPMEVHIESENEE